MYPILKVVRISSTTTEYEYLTMPCLGIVIETRDVSLAGSTVWKPEAHCRVCGKSKKKIGYYLKLSFTDLTNSSCQTEKLKLLLNFQIVCVHCPKPCKCVSVIKKKYSLLLLIVFSTSETNKSKISLLDMAKASCARTAMAITILIILDMLEVYVEYSAYTLYIHQPWQHMD